MPRIAAGAVQKLLLVCGVLSSVVYVAANVLAAMRWEGYSFAPLELMGRGSPASKS